MRRFSRSALLPLLATLAASTAFAAAPAPLTVTVEGIADGQRVPDVNAICLATPDGKSDHNGKNIRPTIRWSGAPATVQSYALFVMDPDVPADFADAGKDGKVVAASAKRQNFFHYGLVSIPAKTTSLPGGAVDGKPASGIQLPNDVGTNKYVAAPEQFGGPCPPWNDERLHHYHFMVLAFDEPAKAPAANETAKLAYERMSTSPHLVGKGEVVGTYSLNPKVK